MLVLLPVVVVQMRGPDAGLQLCQRGCQSLPEMRVTDVQAYADVGEVSGIEDLKNVCRPGHFVLQILDQKFHAERIRKGAEVLERRHRKFEGPRTPRVVALSQVNDQKTKGNLLGNLEPPLDLIHGIDAP